MKLKRRKITGKHTSYSKQAELGTNTKNFKPIQKSQRENIYKQLCWRQ